jgi:hypothetical protein
MEGGVGKGRIGARLITKADNTRRIEISWPRGRSQPSCWKKRAGRVDEGVEVV